MAMVQSAMGGYAAASAEDKDSGNGFEFTRRKKWPQILLQELMGGALFCLKPYPLERSSMDASGRTNNTTGWKIIYISPCGGDMIGQKSTELENRDFLDLVYPADQPLLHTLFSSLIHPQTGGGGPSGASSNSTPSSSGGSSSSGTGKSHTTYARILSSDPADISRSGPVAWELRAHATGLDGVGATLAGAGGYRLDGTVIQRGSADEGTLKGKAVWVMGRRIGSGSADEAQSLDAFLELKLENEKLREELRELQYEIDEEDFQAASSLLHLDTPGAPRSHPARSYMNPIPLDLPSPTSSSPTPSSASGSSSSSSPRKGKEKAKEKEKEKKKPARPVKDKEPREKKRAKKASTLQGAPGASGALGSLGAAGGSGAGGTKDGGEGGMHVCVTCGRTDSPEWRKGPLGPKTLCNACGLRWAKRNSTAPSRKERKAAEAAAAAAAAAKR